MNFANALKKESNFTYTENGMLCHESTLSNLLDIFGDLLQFRYEEDGVIAKKFKDAYFEDPLLAMKLLFYARNIRGLGQGEKKFFRVVCKYMALNHTDVMRKNLHLIKEFGRFDDYYAFVNTPLEKEAFEILNKQFVADLNETDDHKLSLVGKWLKSINSNSDETRKLGLLTAKHFGLSLKDYRKSLSTLRSRINVVEKDLCSKTYESINYENVPSKAMLNYREAFLRNDEERYNKFLENVSTGKSKINAGAIYPYEIFDRLLTFDWDYISAIKDETLEAQWKALPNYIEGEHDCLVVADTSGSMSGLPMSIALSLAVYMAERNKGVWNNKFITFSSRPKFIELKGNSLYEKLNKIPSIVDNTDIEKVFKLILDTAINNNLKPEEMVERIVIVSDMQFDYGVNNSKRCNLTQAMKKQFESHGYTLPKIVYWNASPNYTSTFHATFNEHNVALVAGASPSLFKQVLTDSMPSPLEFMLTVLNDKLFDSVTI